MNEKVLRHKEICDGLNELYARKNHDYGDSFHTTFVEEGLAMARIRLGDKFSRFKTLSRLSCNDRDQQQVTDESIRDTLLDLANYAILALPDGSIVSGKIESWKDYDDGDQIQVKIDGTTYLVHSANIALIKE